MFDALAYSVINGLRWLAVCLPLFAALALLSPGKPGQPMMRKGVAADLIYWLGAPAFYGMLHHWINGGVLLLLLGGNSLLVGQLLAEGNIRLSELPLWIQVAAVLLLSDFMMYWLHRWFHENRMWKFHAVHHSPEEVDWLSNVRFHPVNIILYNMPVAVVMMLIGFSPQVYIALAPFNVLYSAFVHANLSWTLGPLKYVISTPVFHRWHHTGVDEGGSKNFAPTFSFIDILFGTFYMPEGKQPKTFGISGPPMGEDIISQLLYPFRQARKRD